MKIKIRITEYSRIELFGRACYQPIAYSNFLDKHGLKIGSSHVVSIMHTKPKTKGYKRYEFQGDMDFLRTQNHGYFSMCRKTATRILKLPKNVSKKNFVLWAKFTEIKSK